MIRQPVKLSERQIGNTKESAVISLCIESEIQRVLKHYFTFRSLFALAVKNNILEQYIKIRKEISDLERRIAEGNKKIKLLEKQTVCDVVTGSREDFRYGTIKIEGIAKQEIDRQWELLHARMEKLQSFKEKLEDMIVELEEYIQTIPDSEIRRISRFRCMDGLEWRQVAKCIGKGYTDDSCRLKFKRYFQKSQGVA